MRRERGRVKWYSAEKKFGFIVGEDQEYFVHQSEIQMPVGHRRLEKGQEVEFTPTTNGPDRYKAEKVQVIK